MIEHFPTFQRLAHFEFRYSPWKCMPWWPADTLAARQKSLLKILAVAAAEQLEAAPLVANLAIEHRGSYKRRLRRLSQRLYAGTLLADAIEQTPGVLSDDDALAIRFGEQSGILPATLVDLINKPDQAQLRIRTRLRQVVVYSLLTLAVMASVLTFLMIKIIPSLNAIFYDFELDLPRISLFVIAASDGIVRYWWLLAIPGIALVWFWKSERLKRYVRRHVTGRIIKPLAQLRSINVLNLLAGNARAGRPLAGAVSTLARYHFDGRIRQKLLFVRNEMEQGADPWESMSRVQLIAPTEARALQAATSSESRSWTLNRFVELKRGRVERRLEMYLSLLQPAATLLIAIVVLVIAVGCLAPIFDLISALA